jgi:hypothetical protein
MTIKYAEINTIINLKEGCIFYRIIRFFCYRNSDSEKERKIISFDDGMIYDVKSELVDNKFEMGPLGFHEVYPLFFRPPGKSLLMKRSSISEDAADTLQLNEIFMNDPLFLINSKEPSIYNVIYHNVHGVNVFAMTKIYSSETTPTYLLAYDEDFFEKEDIVYFINQIFLNKLI